MIEYFWLVISLYFAKFNVKKNTRKKLTQKNIVFWFVIHVLKLLNANVKL